MKRLHLAAAVAFVLSVGQIAAQEKTATVVEAVENSETTPYTKNTLVVDEKKIFRNGCELKENEVRNLLANTDMLRLYNKGLAKNKKGNTAIFIGCFLLACGIGLISYMGVTSRSHWNGTYHEYHYDNPWSLRLGIPGIIMFLTGVGLGVYGIVLKVLSERYLMDAVNLYNSSI